MLERIHSLFGLFVILGLAYAFSEARGRVKWRRVLAGVLVQVGAAIVLLKIPVVQQALLHLNSLVQVLDQATGQASSFMFGYLAGDATPFEVVRPDKNVVLAFKVLPLILVVSAISAVLFHWGVLPRAIGLISKALQKIMDLPGVLAFAAASSVFLGIIEGPLLIKPYLARMSRSDLFAVLVCGMSTVAGTVMVLYATTLESVLPGAIQHILVASVVSVPAALVVSHLLIPELTGEEAPEEALPTVDELRGDSHSAMEALMKGTQEGLMMILNIVAAIIVLFALVHLANHALGLVPLADGQLTVQGILGTLLRPAAWLMGIPWAETGYAGELLGVKVILNEFVAYLRFAQEGGGGLSERSRLIMTYAMCGFANLGSLGILVGGLGAIVPERRPELIELGWRAVLAGLIATLTTGALIGVLS